MKIKLLLIILFFVPLTCLFSQSVNTQIENEPFAGATLPSEETYRQIESDREMPTLRQAPDEDGTAQKEVPVGNIDGYLILIMVACTLIYAKKDSMKKIKKNY